MIVIIDYGMGNLGSVLKSVKKKSSNVIIGTSINDIKKADKLILPGVGNFSSGMKRLEEYDYLQILKNRVINDKTPILGICLGMQLFSNYSEEGMSKGLGWIDARVVKFNVKDKVKWKVPHMGWNSIKINHKKNNVLFQNILDNEMFYFVHSYHMVCNDKNDILSTSNYEYSFVSSVQKENIYGTQFHPEKSHEKGYEILKNFISI